MIEHRPSRFFCATRSTCVQAFHHFSFGGYMSPTRNGWGELRALNHAVLPPHGKLMPQPIDVVTVVRAGALRIASGAPARQIAAGQVDVVSSGGGVELHRSNPGDQPVEFFEVHLGVAPGARSGPVTDRTVDFPSPGQAGRWALLASGFAEDRLAPPLRACARVLGARLPARGRLEHATRRDRHVYAVAMAGSIAVNGFVLEKKDGAAVRGEDRVIIEALTPAEIILIETV